MSQQIDLPNRDYDLVTFDGTWAAEAHRHVRPLAPGVYVNDSLTGTSSNRHNPGVILATHGAGEHHGECYAFNLVYPGNHYTAVELSHRDLVRVLSGINPTGFEWTLQPGEQFETPEAVLAYSRDGFDGLSGTLHQFVHDHIVPPAWASAERPIVVNTWESAMFGVDEATVLAQARAGRKLGAELVVLDDGWFKARADDHAGLGDYTVDAKKFPHGLAWLSARVHTMGLRFGLWVEPEMVNPDSDLFRAHPDWAIGVVGSSCLQRNQLMLDLSRQDVRDYIVAQVSRAIDDYHLDYIKWDCNRNMTDASGALAHHYALGLCDVLRRIFGPRPRVLLESCASGGNRFDLAMLCFSPQIWASDCTDPVERLDIQDGLSFLYPPSTMGAHVTASPSAQTLRATPLATRFNVAAFGVLGYEFDLTTLSFAERRDVRAQVAFYKRHRRTLQQGRFHRLSTTRPDQFGWATVGQREVIAGHFQTRTRSLTPPGVWQVPGLDVARRYRVTSRPQTLGLDDFGHLLRFVLPKWLNPEGLIVRALGRWYRLPDAAESFTASGAALSAGYGPSIQFEGNDDRTNTRMWADHGSTLYVVTPAG
ncbi:MAG: alpha-galactosidase, partial [Propionibacteriaceae bacterium]|nr:alpha-galactosidase [Propionibacteriaceae bacterium]